MTMIVEIRRHSIYSPETQRLSSEGRALARWVRTSMPPWDLVVCSPVVRAQQTARLLSAGPIETVESLAPRDKEILPVVEVPWHWGKFLNDSPQVIREIGHRALTGIVETSDTAAAESVLVVTHSGIVQSIGSVIRRRVEPEAECTIGFLEGFRMVFDGTWTLTEVLDLPFLGCDR